MKVTVIIIDSRSDIHPDWVNTAKRSIQGQTYKDIELIVVDNVGRKQTIGKCWNEAVKKATGEFCLFVGDDDYISSDLVETFVSYAERHPNHVMYTGNMITFSEKEGLFAPIQRIHTGMWRREYLLKYPFNEELKSGVDREYIEEAVKRNDSYLSILHHFGYYYRKHEDYSCAGDITFTMEPKPMYILASYPTFFEPIKKRFQEKIDLHLSTGKFDSRMANEAEIIWCEWANRNAYEVANHECKAKKILRVHSYEVFGEVVKYIDFHRFDHVIFVSDYIREYVEKHFGTIEKAVTIPNGIDLNKITIAKDKKLNNKIAYAGYISRKKGIDLLIFLANSFPEYEFHVAGKYQEDDVAEYVKRKKPDNMFIHPWQYNINEFYKDKSYVVNTSLREGCPVATIEGMAAGLTPLVFNWVGSDDIFPKEQVFANVYNFKKLLDNPKTATENRNWVKERYDFEDVYRRIENLVFSEEEKIEVVDAIY